jgi:putative ABC transport system permease protein
LTELFVIRRQQRGRLRSALWYWWQVLSFPIHFMNARIEKARRRWAADSSRAGGAPAGANGSGGEGRALSMFTQLTKDVRYAVRNMIKSPGFTVMAVLALALGIGTVTPTFSLINAYFLRPLPFSEPDRLVNLRSVHERQGWESDRHSIPDFLDYREQARTFEDMAAFNYTSVDLTGGDAPESVDAGRVSANVFDVLGVAPELGRGFQPGEDQPGGESDVVVISDGFWERRFGRDPTILGQTIEIGDRDHTIIGVMGPEFIFPLPTTQLWVPRILDTERYSRDRRFVEIVGRLAPGVTWEQAQTELDGIAARLQQEYPVENEFMGVRVFDLRAALNFADEIFRVAGVIFSIAGAFVLLIACANVSSLLLARGLRRNREVAIRTAMGASRSQLVRQFLTESLLLALLSGTIGVLFARWAVSGMDRGIPADLYRVGRISIDGPALLFTLGIVVITALVVGLMPALRNSRVGLSESLKEGSVSVTSTRRSLRLQRTLVVGQVALALVLLVGTTLMLQSLDEMEGVDLGFDSENALTMTFSLRQDRYAEREPVIEFHRALIREVGAVPGVVGAATANYLPLNHEYSHAAFNVPGYEASSDSDVPSALELWASPGYFETMGIRLVRGRLFEQSDNTEAPRVAVVNESAAERYWEDGNPVGTEIQVDEIEDPVLIVGVVEDTKFQDLTSITRPQIYFCSYQARVSYLRLIARTTSDPAEMAPAIREAVWSVDPNLPILETRTLPSVVANFLGPQMFLSYVLAGIAVGAILLATIGIYGVVSFFVSQSTRDMSIRMALGARQTDVLRQVLAGGMRLIAIGVGIGLIGAFFLARALSSFIGSAEQHFTMLVVTAEGLLTFVVIPVALVLVALLACYVPARRATKVDPMVAMRAE